MLDPESIKIYRGAADLPPELWDDLAVRSPEQAASAAGGSWDGSCHHLRLLGREYAIDPAGREITDLDDSERPVGFQSGMLLLLALARGLEAPPSGRMTTPQELPGGAMFFVGPHAVATDQLLNRFAGDEDALLERARLLGGTTCELGDVGVTVPGLPRIPLYALLWRSDGESPARAVVGLDDRAHLHLALDGVWALTNVFVRRLVEER